MVEHFEDNFYFTAEERETVINMCDDSKTCTVFTRQRTVMTKLRKLGIEPTKQAVSGDRVVEETYVIPVEYIHFRKPTKLNLTEEQRQQRSELLKKNRNTSTTK